jgi:6-pyruvoyltetrahydropterin/6-carboxytetrahydropterin synthase
MTHHVFKFARRYSMAHRLAADPCSKCATPHGHNEVVVVECRPTGKFMTGMNMSLSFADAKGAWHAFIDKAVDHAFQLDGADPLVNYFMEHEPQRLAQIMTTPGDPTTEMLTMVLARKFRALCGASLELLTLSVEETPTNTVMLPVAGMSYTEDYVARFMNAPADYKLWFDRADLSINDFHN